MRLKVITPDVTLFDDKAQSLNIAERVGSFTILSDHAPFLTVVKNFVSTIQTETGDLTYIAANSGTLKVLNNEASLIVDYGVIGASKDEAKTNLVNLRKEFAGNSESLGDHTIANLEVELMRRMRELKS